MKSMNGKVAILLSVYNGQNYLEHQLKSIFKQTYDNFILFIRNDRSTDDSLQIIKKYCSLYPDHIVFLNDTNNLGAKLSFGYLLKYVQDHYEFDYYMFSDQDDVWLPDKILRTLDKMKQTEGDGKTPVLIHTDLLVVNNQLEQIDKSFWHYQNLDPESMEFNRLLVQNNITGCTVMINSALAKFLKVIPTEAIMHDWWSGLVASVFGKIAVVTEPTILYRQHVSNTLGAKKFNTRYVIRRIIEPIEIHKHIAQARYFYNQYYDIMDKKNKIILVQFLRLEQSNYLYKIYLIVKNRFFKSGLLRNIGFILKPFS
ncbi:glycosyltransferase family 2 protein [Paenibacillus validus]|uniref:glycosyltransferase family 2 protein n=1 Tax=Paenibacillus validus TaxID=44253 RepID=UPI000FDB5DA3|nr:glycosyltransferase family 2 protein [Paenibacillus validus]MED4599490.1 glycosyltransferase family 2 protein [Paenibacillus validus]MED4606714.1 glycosyltransferase family 2 protein [Paenibacillus validus]